MKLVALLMTLILLCSCAVRREFIGELSNATLIKIDVVDRYPDEQFKRLTWRTANQIDYITFESMSSTASVGDVMKVLTKR